MLGLTERRLQKQCQPLVDGLDIPDPWDVEEFCRRLGAQRGREMQLQPLPPMAGVHEICGLWCPLPEADLIFVKAYSSPWHRDCSILHECSHVLRNHEPSPALGLIAAGLKTWMHPQYDSGEMAKILTRGRFDDPIERETEVLAGLIEERASTHRRAAPRLPVPAQPSEVVEVLDRLARALGTSVR